MPNTPRPAADRDVEVGQVFLGKYRVDRILGHGGMGVVAECTHLALNERVAIKMLRPDVLDDVDAVERFMREAQAVVKLKSEYVARVTDVGAFESGVPYMVMEYLEGQDLGVLLDEQGSIAAQWGTEMVLQASEALGEAHSLGIVHRDVKPSNLFVTWRPDGSALVKVLDFGISKSPMGTDLKLTQTQSLLGTPAYMSPEQMRSARLVDARTDIWSLGTVLYEVLEGCRPFEAESFSEMCVKVAADAPRAMLKAPPGLRPIVLKCLEKNPEQRYATMAELARDLIPFVQDSRQGHVLVERMERTHRRSLGDFEAQPSGPTSIPSVPPGVIPSLVYDAQVAPPQISAGMAVPVALPMHREPSAASELPREQPKKKRRALPILLAACIVLVGVGIGVKLALKNGEPRHARDEARVIPPVPVSPGPSPGPGPSPTLTREPPPPTVIVPPPTTPTAIIEAPGTPPTATPDHGKAPEVHAVRPRTGEKPPGTKPAGEAPAATDGTGSAAAAEAPKVPCDPRRSVHGCNDH